MRIPKTHTTQTLHRGYTVEEEDEYYYFEPNVMNAGSTPTPVDDPRDHDHGHTEAEHKKSNRNIFNFFTGQTQGTVNITPGKTERGDEVAGVKHSYAGDNQEIYGMPYEEYHALTPGDRADLRNANR